MVQQEIVMSRIQVWSEWEVECVDASGDVKWVENVRNIMTVQGLNEILDILFRSVAYTSLWFTGIKDVGVATSSDTLDSHVTWPELSGYSGDRKAINFNLADLGIIDNNGLRPEFDITVDDTIYGMFITDQESGNAPASVLLSIIDFVTPRDVLIGDVLRVNVAYSLVGV